MSQTTVEFLKKLCHFVESEAKTQYKQLDRQWSYPLAERVAKGWAIEGISVRGYQKQIIRLSCETNDSRFREGDLIVLHRGNPRDPDALHCELEYDEERVLEASLEEGNEYLLTEYQEGWIIDQDWFDSSPFYVSALDQAADTQLGRSFVLPLLQGSLQPQVDMAKFDRAVDALKDSELNPSQVEAVAMSYAADLLHLIQGPPGTGKTLMLAHLAKLLVEDGRRVFVTALTHRAIHNALNKIAKVDGSISVSRHEGVEFLLEFLMPFDLINSAQRDCRKTEFAVSLSRPGANREICFSRVGS